MASWSRRTPDTRGAGLRDALPSGMVTGSRGFTLLELVIVLLIGGVLTSVAILGLSGVFDRIAVRSAQSEFLSMHARTRALAVERGNAMQLIANDDPGVVAIREGCAGTGGVLEARNFETAHRVALETAPTPLSVCMTPRGFADPNQNSFGQEGRVDFVRGEILRSVVLFPLGQAVRP